MTDTVDHHGPRRGRPLRLSAALRFTGLVEKARASLFLVPLVAVFMAIAAAAATLAIDDRLGDSADRLPLGFTSTVESARALLATVAGATITFASVAFSIALLIIQRVSAQYSPRAVQMLFRDAFNKRVMAVVVGTFTYCLVVLRSVRSSVEEGGSPVIPNVSVALGVVLGIATVLAIVAFIDHSAHTMNVSEALERTRRSAVEQIRDEWRTRAGATVSDLPVALGSPTAVVRFDCSGWVQQVDVDAILGALPPGTTLRLDTYPGSYAIEGAPACEIAPPPDDDVLDSVIRGVRTAVVIGKNRTMHQDIAFGLRQVTDVALTALSPAVHDPTTAREAIHHLGALLAELLRRDPPADDRTAPNGARVLVPGQPGHVDLIRSAFDEIRRAGALQPTVIIELIDTAAVLHDLARELGRVGAAAALREQARLAMAGCAGSGLLSADSDLVTASYDRRFCARSPHRETS